MEPKKVLWTSAIEEQLSVSLINLSMEGLLKKQFNK